MTLPQNGRIVIVDDSLAEAQPLITILSKKRIPFNYYSGTRRSHFPADVNENKLRLLFLDLNIFELARSAREVISSIDWILRAIIPDRPNPYLLIIWSKQTAEYQTALEAHFRDNLASRTPAKIVFLQKQNYFDFVDGTWVEQDNCLEHLESDLNRELTGLSLLGNLFSWENIVHQMTSDTVNEFSDFFIIDDHWDRNTKAIIHKLAQAIVGEYDITLLNDQQKLAKAFLSINSFLSDKIETEVEGHKLGTISNVTTAHINIPPNILSKVNSKLHISKKNYSAKIFEQGNIYQIKDTRNLITKILWQKAFKTRTGALVGSNPALVFLDITPVCDYSQNKEYVRIVYGVMLDSQFANDCHRKGDYYYRTPNLFINGQEKFFLFDFRYVETTSKKTLAGRRTAPFIKLRREICTDIQSLFSNQVNRPGISNL